MRMILLTAFTAILLFADYRAMAKDNCNRNFSDIYSDVATSVVRIHAIRIDPFRLYNRVDRTIGAGVIIKDSKIVTNAHLIWNANSITVSVKNELRRAWVVGADPISDIAVLEFEGEFTATEGIAWGDSEDVRVGDDVIAIGHPIALTVSATRGIVSGVSRILPISPMSWLTPLIQTDAAIFPGNSGGPLVSRCGKVIGINTLRLGEQSNINFSIPSNLVLTIVNELIKNKRIVRPWHGIHGRVIDSTLVSIIEIALGSSVSHGFLVETIEPGSPAESAGLKGGSVPVVIAGEEYLIGGDIITQVNGVTLETTDEVLKLARSLKVGDKLSIKYLRNGANHSADTVLVERPILAGDVRRFIGVR